MRIDERALDIVCASHLWWSWVWQRPQHLLSRLARRHRVLWVEEPHLEVGPAEERFVVAEERPNLHVAQLLHRSTQADFAALLEANRARAGGPPVLLPGGTTTATLPFGGTLQPRLDREVAGYVGQWRRNPLVLWLYTPAAVPFIDLLQPDLVVLDVMDELSAFAHASPQLKAQEQELLEGGRSDLVFCGGPSLYTARKDRHPAVHLFPSGVEQEHFARALDPDLALPAMLATIPAPRVGFFGVVDERLDLDLLAQAAAARPDLSWVLVGPVFKIPPEQLPKLPNLHYLGKQEYGDLPAFLKGFAVAMLPFARNEATRFISPTKTLEYMAAEVPIVSTGIADVAELYGEVVQIADDTEAFVTAVQAALNESLQERTARVERGQALLARYAWDDIARAMDELIAVALAQPKG